MREVKLNRLEQILSRFDYPMSREAVLDHGDDVVLRLADGEVRFDTVLDDSSEQSFESADEVMNEVMNLLPQRAVGEPYQSDGDA